MVVCVVVCCGCLRCVVVGNVWELVCDVCELCVWLFVYVDLGDEYCIWLDLDVDVGIEGVV